MKKIEIKELRFEKRYDYSQDKEMYKLYVLYENFNSSSTFTYSIDEIKQILKNIFWSKGEE